MILPRLSASSYLVSEHDPTSSVSMMINPTSSVSMMINPTSSLSIMINPTSSDRDFPSLTSNSVRRYQIWYTVVEHPSNGTEDDARHPITLGRAKLWDRLKKPCLSIMVEWCSNASKLYRR
ncbi:hypothetical protein RRG08_003471 [Elysia crispata]|uniref:Uncharacterized protein n=1 Tax=Elysia crispata TaxID=231223 RepID=A0AAE0Y6C0_9GAST|nr:hypothetical protein RRG08_003471 [Elysia crispata]